MIHLAIQRVQNDILIELTSFITKNHAYNFTIVNNLRQKVDFVQFLSSNIYPHTLQSYLSFLILWMII